jgi:hypothetical protein
MNTTRYVRDALLKAPTIAIAGVSLLAEILKVHCLVDN